MLQSSSHHSSHKSTKLPLLINLIFLVTQLSDSSLTMSTSLPSVKDTYFQHKMLKRIHGQPTYETLQNLSTEIKANAALVPSTLGGGQ
jgi:hypothetical protein